jgi:hypothetical protein
LVAKPFQNQPSHRSNSDLDKCGILFCARSGTEVRFESRKKYFYFKKRATLFDALKTFPMLAL